ncbi:hypothetical protein DQ04_09781030 [Trypanosoma grayi]|uniref:hypothetical protein n=1 Tax=Trypanosoma grayi TaxID=71804 RepID=UPI0004F46FC5|nr:hypothetical protein DQ04_09781030 [Trypanosoma grayi]KEG07446.1 hypothetical protein DQ04_09781030 [Trypanosoma grayi]
MHGCCGHYRPCHLPLSVSRVDFCAIASVCPCWSGVARLGVWVFAIGGAPQQCRCGGSLTGCTRNSPRQAQTQRQTGQPCWRGLGVVRCHMCKSTKPHRCRGPRCGHDTSTPAIKP